MSQSKPPSQSDELWIQKNNFAGQWLSDKSKDIINKILNKDMKNLLFTLLFAPLFSFGQTYYDQALTFHNNVRNYFNAPPLFYDNNLAIEAQEWANYIASTGDFRVSDDPYGESIYLISKYYLNNNNKNALLEASIAWILDWEDISTYSQAIYPETNNIGFGISENDEYIYVVAKYDKLWQ